MIDPEFVERIWHQVGMAPSYLKEFRHICLNTDSTSVPGTLDWLPILFCEINGGKRQQILPVISAWTILRHAARLLDDIEDGDIKSRNISEPVALNISTGLLFTVGMALETLEEIGVHPKTAHEIRHMFYKDLLNICSGQHLDLTQTIPTLEESWHISGAKSGTFISLICWAGGRIADADPEQLNLYRQFGYNLGLLDQIRDDLSDLWANDTHHSDLQNSQHKGLAVAYTYSVLSKDERTRFLEYLAHCQRSLDAERSARKVIIESGAGVYLTVQSTYYVQQNQQLLAEMKLPTTARNQLNELLEKIQLPTSTMDT